MPVCPWEGRTAAEDYFVTTAAAAAAWHDAATANDGAADAHYGICVSSGRSTGAAAALEGRVATSDHTAYAAYAATTTFRAHLNPGVQESPALLPAAACAATGSDAAAAAGPTALGSYAAAGANVHAAAECANAATPAVIYPAPARPPASAAINDRTARADIERTAADLTTDISSTDGGAAAAAAPVDAHTEARCHNLPSNSCDALSRACGWREQERGRCASAGASVSARGRTGRLPFCC